MIPSQGSRRRSSGKQTSKFRKTVVKVQGSRRRSSGKQKVKEKKAPRNSHAAEQSLRTGKANKQDGLKLQSMLIQSVLIFYACVRLRFQSGPSAGPVHPPVGFIRWSGSFPGWVHLLVRFIPRSGSSPGRDHPPVGISSQSRSAPFVSMTFLYQ